ncbi:MAG: heme ABC exporter ATP-binding protein CcmA [Rhodospirillaceae bacterium]|jgi:heme exporter protein A|nr:heme ABC exporter ATP-binding protein CcmA [Rhodospirillaceae bacterium]MBT5375001.1 heme ABC exporter ATP-binding protein CcmA [Rhodospirillaceae bacterium]MBT5751237.1 heme ABC exporter ATP-binding protein CcmA [Rhodospirillaceae bacterium]
MNRFSGEALTCLRGGRTVFTGLDFALDPGDALVLLGPNGSGKSSLLRIMAGLAKPGFGRMMWCGNPVDDEPEEHHARLHYVGHLDSVKASMTLTENLSFWAGLRVGGRPPPGIIRSALGSFGLDHLADYPCRLLSAGQKRRLNLARTLASPAEIWLLDEPTVALDRESVSALEHAIARHRRRGGMVVVATHSEMALGRAQPLYLDRFAPPTGLAGLQGFDTNDESYLGNPSEGPSGGIGR